MVTNISGKKWTFEENGKLHFKQDQLFQLHRLTLVILGETGIKLRYGTPQQLRELLTFASRSWSKSVNVQFNAALGTLPDSWRSLSIAS